MSATPTHSDRSHPGQSPRSGPTTGSERLQGLDVLRGFALYGVFLTNAFVTAMPMSVALKPPTEGPFWREGLGWWIFDGLLVMKFVTLFSLLFGMGLVLQHERARARNAPFQRPYKRRLFALATMGILHGCLLFEGDILFVYALVGFGLYLLRDRSTKTLLCLAAVPLALGVLVTLGGALVGIDEMTDPEEGANSIKILEGSLGDVLAQRWQDYIGWLLLSSLVISFNLRVVGLFLIGAALMKKGLLGETHAALHRKLAWVGLPLGGALQFLDTGLAHAFRHESLPLGLRVLGALSQEIGSLILSAGYIGLVLSFVHSGYLPLLQRGLAAVGRTALTNYLLQSVFLNVLFMGFGLGLYEELSRTGVLALASLLFLGQVLISLLWLERFPMGPIEGLWRRFTYGGRGSGTD